MASRKTDSALLGALLGSGRLSEEEETAFRDMLGRFDTRPNGHLTDRQRSWAESVYNRLDLESEEGAANLISSGAYKPTAAERAKKYPWELAPRPRKPPGRACPEGTGPCKCCESCKRQP